MTAPKGNGFWATRSRHGRKPIFETGRQLWVAACEYFDWVEENPLIETVAASDHGMATTLDIRKPRAMSIGGLCVFLDISPSTWATWRNREVLCQAVSAVEQLIRAQQFEGAAAGIFGANIMSRVLWLAEQRRYGWEPHAPAPATTTQLAPIVAHHQGGG
jgi:hypothetical protein